MLAPVSASRMRSRAFAAAARVEAGAGAQAQFAQLEDAFGRERTSAWRSVFAR
jgi:hypothetical protein